MGTGVSSALLLMGGGTSDVHTFDLGSDAKRRIVAYLNMRFGNRLRPHWGDFEESIPASQLACDLIFVDALHPADVIISIEYLAHPRTKFLYHNGGAGEVKARDFLISSYPDSWEELATSDTERLDGRRAVYYLGRRAGMGRDEESNSRPHDPSSKELQEGGREDVSLEGGGAPEGV